jgi:hypothetical protein
LKLSGNLVVTLILAQASRLFALQVSDRLATRSGKVFDPTFNKNVLFVARDAIVAFGCTGLAYLEGRTTDQWVAEVLFGQRIEDATATLRSGDARTWVHIGPAVQRLGKRMREALRPLERSAEAKQARIEILGVGWQWSRRKPPRPIMLGVKKAPGSGTVETWYGPREMGRKFLTAATPDEDLRQTEAEAMRAGLRGDSSADSAEGVLVKTIRRVAKRSPYVGPDCLSILIPPPSVGWARVRYLPLSATSVTIRDSSGRVRQSLPAAFSPWIVSRGLLHAPSVLIGQMVLNLGGFVVHLEAPEPKGPGLRAVMSRVRRRPEPR